MTILCKTRVLRAPIGWAPRLVFILVLWLGLSGLAIAAPTVLVFGDSLSAAHGMAQSEGWVALLRQDLKHTHATAKVINASVSGETSAGGRSRFKAALERSQPDIVVLELGANDGLQVLDLNAMRANLAAMIETAQKQGARVLLLGMRIPPNYGPTYTKRFHAVFGDLAKRYGVAYDPFFLEPIADDRGNFQADGIHPKASVQPILAKRVLRDLKPLLNASSKRAH